MTISCRESAEQWFCYRNGRPPWLAVPIHPRLPQMMFHLLALPWCSGSSSREHRRVSLSAVDCWAWRSLRCFNFHEEGSSSKRALRKKVADSRSRKCPVGLRRWRILLPLLFYHFTGMEASTAPELPTTMKAVVYTHYGNYAFVILLFNSL